MSDFGGQSERRIGRKIEYGIDIGVCESGARGEQEDDTEVVRK